MNEWKKALKLTRKHHNGKRHCRRHTHTHSKIQNKKNKITSNSFATLNTMGSHDISPVFSLSLSHIIHYILMPPKNHIIISQPEIVPSVIKAVTSFVSVVQKQRADSWCCCCFFFRACFSCSYLSRVETRIYSRIANSIDIRTWSNGTKLEPCLRKAHSIIQEFGIRRNEAEKKEKKKKKEQNKNSWWPTNENP